MSIKVTAGIPSPALVYDNILVTNFSLSQDPSSDNITPSPIKIVIYYKLYAIDAGNKRIFNGKVHKVEIFDFDQEASNKLGVNGISMRNYIPALEKMISIIINDKGTVGNTEVS